MPGSRQTFPEPSNRHGRGVVQWRMTKPAPFRRIRRLIPALVLAAAGTAVYAQSTALQIATDAERLIKALDIKPGSVVAEIGAGDGALTVAIAKAVGETGRVYSNELSKDRLPAIRKLADDEGLRNVTVVEGKEDGANLPDACCEAIFMRDVYRHFSDPPLMNASLLRALKPGGRMALIEFTPPPPSASNENPPGHRGEDNHHGVTLATLEKELTVAGFEFVGSVEVARAVFVVVRRPQK
jgi:SAM-dependent methyltransferase